MKCAINTCSDPALTLSQFCWDHLPDKEGFKKSLADAAVRGDDLAGFNLRKADLRSVHLEKARLERAVLCQANLSGGMLFDARMDGADLIGADLTHCDLSHCGLRGADLTRARLAHSRLWNADLSLSNLSEADLSYTDLWNTRLYGAKLWHASLLEARSLTMRNFSSGDPLMRKRSIDESGFVSAEEAYRELKKYFIINGMYNDASWASFKEKSMERKVLKKKKDLNYVPSLLMNILCGYGEKPYRIVLSAVLVIFLYAAAYRFIGAVVSTADPGYMMHWGDYIYFSTITYTTVGYGDFIPKSHIIHRLLTASEAFTGVFLTGLFVFTLARKYSAR